MNKRGLSGIVVTILLVALSIVAISIVWTVIANMINTNLDNAETALTKINLNIIDGSVINTSFDQSFSLKVDRSYDESELIKINFLIYTTDGETIEDIRTNDLKPGEGKTYEFNLNTMDEIDNIYKLEKISIYPTILTEGKEKILPVTDTHKFNFEE